MMKVLKRIDGGRLKGGKKIYKALLECPICQRQIIRYYKARNNNSCGCARLTANGESGTKLYQVWNDMIARCTRKNATGYYRYGGRGIKVTKEWLVSFPVFKEWAIKNGYSKNLEIDRINNDGDYEPTNCRFVTHRKNNRNKSTNSLKWVHVDAIRDLTKNGMTRMELSLIFGVAQPHISNIVNNKAWIY